MPMYCYICKQRGQRNVRSLFSIPKEPHIQKEWLRICNIEEDPNSNYIKYKVCSEHFANSDIAKMFPRPLLRRGAIPYIRNILGEKIQAQTVSHHQYQSIASGANSEDPDMENPGPSTSTPISSPRQLQATCSSTTTPKNKRKLAAYKLVVKRYRMRHQRLQRQKRRDRTIAVAQLIQQSKRFLNPISHALFATQLQLSKIKKAGYRFSNEMKDFALSVFYHSPRAYRFLLKVLTLPSIRTLHTYQQSFEMHSGLNIQVLNHLKNIFKDKEDSEKIVNLIFDEIHLNREIHYEPNKDKFIGVEDHGELRTPMLAKTALVLQIVWIKKCMKQSIGYYLCSSKTSNVKLRDIVFNAIDRLHESNIIVKCLVCDQAPINQSLFKSLNVTISQPHFIRNNCIIHCMYDFPHLLKSFRNNLLKSDIKYKGGIASWKDVQTVFDCSKLKKLNLIPKISEKHMNLNHFSKMKVRYAAQIFSESMHTAMLCYQTIYPEKFSEQSTTAQLILDMDKLFDCVNSSLLKKPSMPKFNYAIHKNSEHVDFLRNIKQSLTSIIFINKKNPPCINGWILSIESLLNLVDDLNNNYHVNKIQTRRLNQDPLENLFAVIRQQHGCNSNPSVRNFEAGFKHIFITQMSKVSDMTNCEPDLNSTLIKLSSIAENSFKKMNENEKGEDQNILIDVSQPTIDYEDKDLSIENFGEQSAVYYIAGYICNKFIKKTNCDICADILFNDSATFSLECLYTTLKNKTETKGLSFVKTEVFNTILVWENAFNNSIEELLAALNVSRHLYNILNSCKELHLCNSLHSEIFLKIFITIRCHWEARFIRQNIQNNVNSNKYKKFL